MSLSTVNICILILVLLCLHSSHSWPHSLSKRAIIDYIKPALFAPIEFEKGNDGKLYLKRNFHKRDSTVNYLDDSVTSDKDKKMFEDGSPKTPVAPVPPKSAPAKGDNLEISSNIEEVKTEEKKIPETEVKRKEISDKAEIEAGKAPYTPVNTKLLVSSKPDSKDEIAEPDVLPPTDKDEKVAIGEGPPTNTFRIPLLIPVRQISFGTVSILPLPPASGSDRLPMPYDDEIVGEGGHESEPLEDSEEKEAGLPLGDPYVPALPFTGNFLKDLKEAADKQDAEKNTKIVDILGKKFVMQSNILKYPRGDLGHTFVRFMSIKPLEEVDPKLAEGEKKIIDGELGKEIEKKKEIARDELSMTKENAEAATKEKEIEKEPLKAEETLVKVKTESPEKTEDNFKEYEDPYLKGIEEIHKKHSFEGIIGEGRENGEEKMKVADEKSSAEETVALKEAAIKKEEDRDTLGKDVKKDVEIDCKESIRAFEDKHTEMKIKKENGKSKEKIEKKKRKCKCADSDSTEED